MVERLREWLASLEVYRDRRMVLLAGLGFSSGLPRLLVYSTLSFWLVEAGLEIESVGLFAATALPYNLKFLWAPLLDRVALPVLGERLGLRRGWLLALQLLLAVALTLLAASSPAAAPIWCAVAAIAVAAVSASQDVVIDAYRVELLDDEDQGAGAAAAVFGYRIGMLAASAGALYLSAWSGSWPATYLAMATLVGVGVVATVMCEEPERPESDEADESPDGFAGELEDATIGPLRNFARHEGWALILLFVLLYKLGDALAGAMTNPFMVEIGFSKEQIANIAKTYGLVASIAGVFIGGALVRSAGIVKSLWVAGFFQMSSNLMFCYQATVGVAPRVLTATIGVEKFSAGLASAAFVAYLSALCDERYTATQYALLTALASLLETLASTTSGYLADYLGWVTYFAATAGAALPGLGLLAVMTALEWTGLDDEADP